MSHAQTSARGLCDNVVCTAEMMKRSAPCSAEASLEVTEPRSIRTCYDILGLGKHFAMHHIERA